VLLTFLFQGLPEIGSHPLQGLGSRAFLIINNIRPTSVSRITELGIERNIP
jgi:hypothetical protein